MGVGCWSCDEAKWPRWDAVESAEDNVHTMAALTPGRGWNDGKPPRLLAARAVCASALNEASFGTS